jgi:hypothetical protein
MRQKWAYLNADVEGQINRKVLTGLSLGTKE